MRSGLREMSVAGRLTGIAFFKLGRFFNALISADGYLPRSASSVRAALSRWRVLFSIDLWAEATLVRLSCTAMARVPGTPAL